MKIIIPPDFFQILKDRHILLDTSVFIDSFLNPTNFGELFNKLKAQGTTLVTLDVVKAEFLKGTPNTEKYRQKEEFLNQIVDALMPTTVDTYDNLFDFIKIYKEDGKSLSITDLLLGAVLMQYRNTLLLLSKNTTEFSTNVFNLVTYMNISYTKGLHSYGIYNFSG